MLEKIILAAVNAIVNGTTIAAVLGGIGALYMRCWRKT